MDYALGPSSPNDLAAPLALITAPRRTCSSACHTITLAALSLEGGPGLRSGRHVNFAAVGMHDGLRYVEPEPEPIGTPLRGCSHAETDRTAGTGTPDRWACRGCGRATGSGPQAPVASR
jgi:hypothetical protein